MELDDSGKKVKEELWDIGCVRLGFYNFPFWKNYPCVEVEDRDHQYKKGHC
jgi:hypothetical protein